MPGGGWSAWVTHIGSERVSSLGQKCGATEFATVEQALLNEGVNSFGAMALDLSLFPTLRVKVHTAVTSHGSIMVDLQQGGLMAGPHVGFFERLPAVAQPLLGIPCGITRTTHPKYTAAELQLKCATDATPLTRSAAQQLYRVSFACLNAHGAPS